ncbi:3'-5' exonuclease, partial [Thermobrachium celere]|uniref:3'-5' exonuclease n=1 Tax=Thermobrachium celere TaxID=53422 RepID=UPI001942CC41
MFYSYNNVFSEYSLTKNYRSQENIVNLANDITKLRKECIGCLSDDYIEKSIRAGEKIKLMKPSDLSLGKILNFISMTGSAILIVPDDEVKDYIKNKFNKNINVFTVHEIKGLEYDIVFCYNVISTFADYWTDILNKNTKHSTKHRYYFNLFYVSITRAKNDLIILEENLDLDIIKYIFRHCEIVDENNLIDFLKGFKSVPAEEMRLYAKKLELNNLFDQAMSIYDFYQFTHDYRRCEIKKSADEWGYEKAGDELIKIGEYEEAIEYYRECNNYTKTAKAMILSGKYKNEKFNELLQYMIEK